MGSWLKTCGLSNLHIKENDDVYVFVLEQNKNIDRCYTTSYWKPISLSFNAKYNSYGEGKDCTGIAFPIIMDAIKNSLKEMVLGENQCHDIEVKRDNFNIDLFFEAVYENRLFLQNDAMLDFVMFRKDVVDFILDNITIKKYTQDGYIYYKFQDIVDDIDEYIRLAFDEVAHLNDFGIKFFKLGHINAPNNKVCYYLIDHTCSSRLVNANKIILNYLVKGNIDDTKSLIINYLLTEFINEFMNDTRKLWIPAGHEGSQSMQHSSYRILMAAVDNALNNEMIE